MDIGEYEECPPPNAGHYRIEIECPICGHKWSGYDSPVIICPECNARV
jgi:hypothetical protein